MEKIGSYILRGKIQETRNSIIYQGQKDNDSLSYIVKVFKAKNPSPSEIAQFRHEYELLKKFNLQGIIKPFDIIRHEDGFALILEDFDGVTIKSLLEQKIRFDITSFLKISSKIAESLGSIHVKGVIHRDIKPHHILFNPETGVVKITDFGVSLIQTHENDEIYHPDFIVDTLAYISPEQTGRMNRAVDYRTDLYSLGVTMYEMLTGSLPYKSPDPMELVHSHIAVMPAPPAELAPDIPVVISDIIMKLLSKNPEDRYQNSLGLMADIEECLRQAAGGNGIDKFPLASMDIPIKFNFPQILVGREKESELLLSACERCARGASEIAFVHGSPGIGKSALIREIQRLIAKNNGYFITGKYDQFRRDVPYSAIIESFQGIIKQLLSENTERIKSWREKLVEAVGPNGKIITDVIPDLEHIIGKQPDVESLGPEESQNRLNIVFQNFINVFNTMDHLLVLFLDDIQWSDMASLNLIKAIISDSTTKHLLLIGAYRDNEISSHHPLSITLDEIQKKRIRINTISLTSLDITHVNKMIVNVLRRKEQESIGLAELIHKKTGGNPFFVNQFLKRLYDSHVIELDPKTGWIWDLNKIQEMQFTDNVVEFLTGKILTLPENTRKTLKVCACMGNRFDLETVSTVLEKTIEDVLSDISVLINEDLVSLYGDIYKFQHDRIQETAYSLLTPDEREQTHYKIGTFDLERTPAKELFNRIFYIVDQLNESHALIKGEQERCQLAELNLKASIKAKESTAYSAAVNYLKKGMDLLPENPWLTNYQLTYTFFTELMLCQYLDRNPEESERLFQIIIANAASKLDKARAYNTMLMLYLNMRTAKDATVLGIEALNLLGVRLSIKSGVPAVLKELARVKFKLRNIQVESIIDLPRMQDEEAICCVDLFINTGTPAYIVNPYLYAVLVLKSVNLSLKYGHHPSAAVYFMGLASIIQMVLGDYKQGYRIGKMALKLHDRLNTKKFTEMVYHIFGLAIQHWTEQARNTLDTFSRVYQLSMENGNFLYMGYSITKAQDNRLFIGDNLDDIVEESKKYSDLMNYRVKDPIFTARYQENIQLARAFMGLTDDCSSMTSPEFDQKAHLERLYQENNTYALCLSLLYKVKLLYFFGKYEKARTTACELEKYIEPNITNLFSSEHYFYYSLILTALMMGGEKKHNRKYIAVIRRNQRKMHKWDKHCPENFQHKFDLMAAETLAVNRHDQEAILRYHAAIEGAQRHRYKHEEALACERLATFYLFINCPIESKVFMHYAYQCYNSWGARAKVKEIEKRYPNLIKDKFLKVSYTDSITGTKTTSLITGPSGSQTLDLATVINISQALSSEIELGKLLISIMKFSMVNAGAQSGYLIIEDEDDKQLYIEASGKAHQEIDVLKSLPVEGNDAISESIVNYVHKTGESVVLGNASSDQRFLSDPYIVKYQPKSLLCVPIRYKGKATSIIYLENNLATDAFTPERLQLLQMFSAQASISIENSRLIMHRENETKLKTEMNIAAEIQQSMLPRHPAMEGFEITAYMKPADDVGGDYYDVITTPVRNWIVIGDVSGHGVPSGLIMMMVQTAIQTMVRKFPEIKPSELLSAVNETVRYNIENMAQQKYMTITAFSFDKNGTVLHSGQHLNLLIYRESLGDVEIKPSSGIWLSPWDLGQKSIDGQFMMKRGDVLLLYTDGITEAMDSDEKMFSEQKLVEVLKKSGKLKTDAIKNNILSALNGYTIKDDVTAVVLKKLSHEIIKAADDGT